MKFGDFLDAIERFSGELITISYESVYSFEWDYRCYTLSKYGKKYFSKILNSECTLKYDVITLLDRSITDEDLEFFLRACAGAISQSKFDLLFDEKS